MTERTETYTLDDFTTGEWSERPEYAEGELSFSHVERLHMDQDDFVEDGACGKGKYWFFLHQSSEVHFEFYLYWADPGGNCQRPSFVEPFLWVYGTTFDGVRECSGGQNFPGDLLSMAEALQWLHSYCCRRWQGFAELYELFK